MEIILICIGGWVIYRVIKSYARPGLKIPEPTVPIISLADCRETILTNMYRVLQVVIECVKIEETHQDIGAWTLLLIDIRRYIAAIEKKPDDIPVIIGCLLNLGFLLEDTAKREPDGPASILYKLRNLLVQNAEHAGLRLCEIHGHKITDAESQGAVDFIDSLVWNPELKRFI